MQAAALLLLRLVAHVLPSGRVSRVECMCDVYEACGVMWKQIQDLYADMRSEYRLTSLRPSMFCDPEAPMARYPLLTTAIKAAEVRHLTPVVYQLAVKYDSGSDEHTHRRLMMQGLARFYSAVDSSPDFPSASESDMMQNAVESCVVHYGHLARLSVDRGRMMYSMVNKHHFAVHLAQQATYLNPRRFWTYMFEDHVGVMIKIASSCTPGTSVLSINSSIADKVRLVAHMRMNRNCDPI